MNIFFLEIKIIFIVIMLLTNISFAKNLTDHNLPKNLTQIQKEDIPETTKLLMKEAIEKIYNEPCDIQFHSVNLLEIAIYSFTKDLLTHPKDNWYIRPNYSIKGDHSYAKSYYAEVSVTTAEKQVPEHIYMTSCLYKGILMNSSASKKNEIIVGTLDYCNPMTEDFKPMSLEERANFTIKSIEKNINKQISRWQGNDPDVIELLYCYHQYDIKNSSIFSDLKNKNGKNINTYIEEKPFSLNSHVTYIWSRVNDFLAILGLSDLVNALLFRLMITHTDQWTYAVIPTDGDIIIKEVTKLPYDIFSDGGFGQI